MPSPDTPTPEREAMLLADSGVAITFRCRNCGANPPTEWGAERRCKARKGEHYLRAGCEYIASIIDPDHARSQINGVLAELSGGDYQRMDEIIEALRFVVTEDLTPREATP